MYVSVLLHGTRYPSLHIVKQHYLQKSFNLVFSLTCCCSLCVACSLETRCLVLLQQMAARKDCPSTKLTKHVSSMCELQCNQTQNLHQYLFLQGIYFTSQPLAHPVKLCNFRLCVAEVVPVSPGRDLQLFILMFRKKKAQHSTCMVSMVQKRKSSWEGRGNCDGTEEGCELLDPSYQNDCHGDG